MAAYHSIARTKQHTVPDHSRNGIADFHMPTDCSKHAMQKHAQQAVSLAQSHTDDDGLKQRAQWQLLHV
jgi:hypothetical protein